MLNKPKSPRRVAHETRNVVSSESIERSTAKNGFVDLRAQQLALRPMIDEAICQVLNHCQFILGPEVESLESQLAKYCGVANAVTCASGTDALVLALRALEIGSGDAVLCPAFTFCATAEAIALVGAVPVFIDVDPLTYTLDPKCIPGGVSAARLASLVPRAVISVDLFGLPADHDALADATQQEKLLLLNDAAQSVGATYKGNPTTAYGIMSTTSFFPTKPLGCYGDGGAVFTNSDKLAQRLRSLRVHGQGSSRYEHTRLGMTSRLDTLQAAILLAKLSVFPEEVISRNQLAERYTDSLAGIVETPHVPLQRNSVWAQYTVRFPHASRDSMAESLRRRGVPTMVYYPVPLHKQVAYMHFPVGEDGLTVSEQLAAEVLSLPMHAYLDPAFQDRVVNEIRNLV